MEHPEVMTLPRERRPYCKVAVDVRGKRYEADAYDKAAEACGTVLAGSKVRVACDLVQHETDLPQGKKVSLGLRVRHIRVLERPRRGLAG